MKILNFKNYFICLLISIVIIIIGLTDPFYIETARLKSFDYYQRNKATVEAENVAIVEIDESSLDMHGQWPWPRDLIADSVIKAYENGAALVVLPILFSESDRMGHDEYFNDVISQAPVVLGQSASTKGKGVPVPRGIVVIGEDLTPYVFEYEQAIGPLQELGKSAAGVGMMTTTPELDGVVRRMPLIVQVDGKYYPTLSLEILRLFGGRDSYQVKVDELGIQSLRIYGLDPILTDASARIWLNYKYKFPTISFTTEDWSQTVQDKIVIISPTAEGLTNTVATSVGVTYSHIVHATNLQMIVDEERLERQEEFIMHELIITAGICSLIIIGALWLHYWASLITIACSMVALPYFGNLMFENNKLYDFTWPMFTVFITWSAATFIRFIQENKTKKLIKNQFEHYLAPSIVKILQKNPDSLQLGGKTRELSILFSDLRDFTALSEKFKSDPQELTELINKYLTPMTGCVIDNNGTVDKFIGDALMAFWNAPIDDKDHRYNAINCALSMFDLLKDLNKELEERGIELKMGIGVNTGDVVVGNMGSNQRFDYTCLGDAVNLAARLESQTKSYRVGLLVGNETYQELKDRFTFVELDLIAVKGKTEGIRIYTVISSNNCLPNQESFLQAYRNKNWESAVKHANFNKKAIPELAGYYDMMIERIEYLIGHEPGENWDTIFRATTK
ncbi:adenylate/guanylate cyclase domain-containing protein [bacterium]|nr:adenylate/guanylate cyclase domain-containing protein [bacterium]